jgi:hypothetical protein
LTVDVRESLRCGEGLSGSLFGDVFCVRRGLSAPADTGNDHRILQNKRIERFEVGIYASERVSVIVNVSNCQILQRSDNEFCRFGT